MPRRTTTKRASKTAATPATLDHVVFVRVNAAMHATLAEVTDELNAASVASGDVRQWSQSDVVRAVLARWLRDRKQGDLP